MRRRRPVVEGHLAWDLQGIAVIQDATDILLFGTKPRKKLKSF